LATSAGVIDLEPPDAGPEDYPPLEDPPSLPE